MKNFIQQLFLGSRLYMALIGLGLVFLLSYWNSILFPVGVIFAWAVAFLFVLDITLLYSKPDIVDAQRKLPEKFSNADVNEVGITLQNNHKISLDYTLIDEIPIQFQKRDFELRGNLIEKEKKESHLHLSALRKRRVLLWGSPCVCPK